MTKLTFDTEGITSCPMNGTATAQECIDCIYRKVNDVVDECIYEDVYPEECSKAVHETNKLAANFDKVFPEEKEE